MREAPIAPVFLVMAFSLLAGGLTPVHAQPSEEVELIARFREAKALASAPTGRLYVADAGRDVIRVLDREGTSHVTLGGSGTRAGEFDDPSDVDPTNGLTVLVADAGNGRVQRFTEEGQYLEAVPIGRGFLDGREQRVYDDGRDGASVQGPGEPIAVASSSGDETFVIDSRNNVVLKWDEQRRPERVIGPFSPPSGAMTEPVALALDGNRRLFVGDRGQGAVLAFDLFGTFDQRIDTPALPDIQALTMDRGRLWIVCPDRVFVWNPETNTTVEHPVDVPAPLLDAARRGDEVFLLTATHLYRRSLW